MMNERNNIRKAFEEAGWTLKTKLVSKDVFVKNGVTVMAHYKDEDRCTSCGIFNNGNKTLSDEAKNIIKENKMV